MNSRAMEAEDLQYTCWRCFLIRYGHWPGYRQQQQRGRGGRWCCDGSVKKLINLRFHIFGSFSAFHANHVMCYVLTFKRILHLAKAKSLNCAILEAGFHLDSHNPLYIFGPIMWARIKGPLCACCMYYVGILIRFCIVELILLYNERFSIVIRSSLILGMIRMILIRNFLGMVTKNIGLRKKR